MTAYIISTLSILHFFGQRHKRFSESQLFQRPDDGACQGFIWPGTHSESSFNLLHLNDLSNQKNLVRLISHVFVVGIAFILQYSTESKNLLISLILATNVISGLQTLASKLLQGAMWAHVCRRRLVNYVCVSAPQRISNTVRRDGAGGKNTPLPFSCIDFS